MKFGRTLLEEQSTAPLPYKNHFIGYKGLKKYLKYNKMNKGQGAQPGANSSTKSDLRFLKNLMSQLKEVDRCFEREARKVLMAYQIDSSSCRYLDALLQCQPSGFSAQDPMALAMKARWCRRYAELNYMALRKIAKKRDRMLGGRLGEEFMQSCFRGELQARNFMSASLLAELSAIESIMLDRAEQMGRPPQVKSVEMTEVELQEMAVTAPIAAEIEETQEVDKDHTCAICLDLLYQPVSLACGHTFCARCALAAAVGHDRLIGNAETLLLSMACYSTEKPCPSCRTSLYGNRRAKHSPFWDLVQCHRLADLIKQRYPEEYQRRKQEDAEQQARLRGDRPTAWETLRTMIH